MTEREKTVKQDFVDNSIFDLLTLLNPSKTELKWGIHPISEVREVIVNYFSEELKLCSEEEFYPYSNDE